MKKIKVYAYTKQNLGDDLFIKILCERYPNTQFVLYAPDVYKDIFKDNKNLEICSSEAKLNRVINFIARKFGVNNYVDRKLVENSDGGVYIGGSLFIQGENWREYTENYIKPMKRKDKPFYLLGVNFGPFNNEEYYLEHKKIFEEYTDICFREKYSYEMFKDLNNTRIADDIVFGLKGIKIKQGNSVVISVIRPSYREELQREDLSYYKKIKEMCIEFINKGLEVTLMSFCKSEGDEDAVIAIMSLIPDEYKNKIHSYYYETNINEALDVLANARAIVASRFHAMILGLVFEKPILPLIYSNKMTNVLEDIKFKGPYYNIKKLDKANIDYSWIENNNESVKKQAINAENHFKKLDEFLTKGV